MKIKVEMYFEIEDDALEELKKIESHADYLLDLESYPEIKRVEGVSVTAMQNPMKTWTICHREELCGYFDIEAETPEAALEEYYRQVEEGKVDFSKLEMVDSSDTFE